MRHSIKVYICDTCGSASLTKPKSCAFVFNLKNITKETVPCKGNYNPHTFVRRD